MLCMHAYPVWRHGALHPAQKGIVPLHHTTPMSFKLVELQTHMTAAGIAYKQIQTRGSHAPGWLNSCRHTLTDAAISTWASLWTSKQLIRRIALHKLQACQRHCIKVCNAPCCAPCVCVRGGCCLARCGVSPVARLSETTPSRSASTMAPVLGEGVRSAPCPDPCCSPPCHILNM